MGRVLEHRSNRWTHDGWAVRIKGVPSPLRHTCRTTRAEAREVKRRIDEEMGTLLSRPTEVVKVKIELKVVGK